MMTPEKMIIEASLNMEGILKTIDNVPAMTAPKAAPTFIMVDRYAVATLPA